MKNNKKSATVLFGSPRNEGFTSKLLSYFLKELNDYNITFIDSYKENIHPCIDCGICKTKESCRFHDLDDFDYCLRTTDLLIIATPIYNLSVPAPLKAIFDRMQRYFSARFYQNKKPPIKKNKYVALLLTCGSNDKRGPEIVISQIEMISTILNAKLIGTIIADNTDKNTNIQNLIPEIQKIVKLL